MEVEIPPFWCVFGRLPNTPHYFFHIFRGNWPLQSPKIPFSCQIFLPLHWESNYVHGAHSLSAQKIQRTKICEKLVSASLWCVHTSSGSTDCSYFLVRGRALTQLMSRSARNSAVLYSIFKLTPIQQVSKLMWTLSLFFKLCFPIIYGFPPLPPPVCNVERDHSKIIHRGPTYVGGCC